MGVINVFVLIITLKTSKKANDISMEANELSKQLTEYQIEQERLPRVTCLNQTLTANLNRKNNNYLKSSSAAKNLKLTLNNIGAGTAQNCEISWDIEDIKNNCLELETVDTISTT